jgi:hypothetical protein
MKEVSLRDFQLKPTKYLKDLPIVLTRYGRAIAIIQVAHLPPDDLPNALKEKEIKPKEKKLPEKKIGICQNEDCHRTLQEELKLKDGVYLCGECLK